MASQINFENHIKRFMESMRGMQRILYVGTKIDLNNYSALARLPWRCIYTTSSDESLAEVFSISNERQVKMISSKAEYDKAGNKLDSKNPLLIYINGYNLQDGESDDLVAEIERKNSRSSLCKSMGALLNSELMVELTIVGYNPADPKEISPEDLFSLFYTLSDNRVSFYGLTESEESNKYIAELEKRHIAYVFSQDLGEALEEALVKSSFFDDEPMPSRQDSADLRNTVYINGAPVALSQSLCYDFTKYGRVLSVAEMFPGTITRSMQVDFFYQFLKRSPNSPQWYGYAGRNGFAVKRDYEERLYQLVIKGVETNSDAPIILAGQSSSGKSIALGALAYRIFQEHKYPVLFINNPDVSFVAGSPAAIALDNILKEIRDLGGHAVVILDWSLYSFRNNAIRSISDMYYNRGQKALFVASAMNEPKNDSRYKVLQAPISLSDSEKKAFRNLIVEKGKLPQSRVEQWMKTLDKDPGLLSLLYTLLYDLHPQLESGIRQEISKALADTKENILELEDPIPMKREMTALATQLAKLYPEYIPQENSDEIPPDIKQQIIDSLQLFSESIAVASLFKLRMPLTMALHLLNIPDCQNRQLYRDVVLNAPWLAYAMDDDKYAPGEYYVEFRAPIDAKIYLNSIDKSEPDMMEIVADIIRTLNKDNESFYSSEVRFLERLIRMIGPNSDDPRVKKDWFFSYGQGCPSVIAALSELRDSGIIEPLLVAQEITYIREYFGNDQQMDLSVRISWLQKAIQIARDVLDMVERPNVEVADWNQGLIDSITVESIFAELQLERCYAEAEHNLCDKSEAPSLYSYSTRSKKLLEVINGQPENSYAYTALLSCFLAQYEDVIYSAALDAETFRNMYEVFEVVDMAAVNIPAVEHNEFYQKKKSDFLRVFDEACGSGRAEEFFNELLEMGSAVGVYIKAKTILRDANLKYNETLDKRAESACIEALALLENDEYASVVSTNAACQYMRIQLTWLFYNKKPLFQHERQTTHLTEKQWAHLYSICRQFKNNIIDRQPECLNRATVLYIMALACAQLGEYEEAAGIWREVHEGDFFDTLRQRTWHVLCNPDGTPEMFTGTFNRGALPDQRIYIKEMQRAVFYRSLQSINKSEPSGEAADLCIGISYRGFRAFAENRETWRD